MRGRIYLGIILVLLVFNNSLAQDTVLHKPLFYALSPKVFEYQHHLNTPYEVVFDGNTYRFEKNQIHTFKGFVPLVIDRKRWSAAVTFDYNYWQYTLMEEAESHAFEHLSYNHHIRLSKKLNLLKKTWIVTSTLTLEGEGMLENQRIGLTLNAITPVKVGQDRMLLGGVFIFMKGNALPFLPLLRYSTWLSRRHRLLWDIKIPPFESRITKVVNNGLFLRGGVGLTRSFNFTSNEEFTFLPALESYENFRLNSNVFLGAEKHLYHNIWIGGRMGYQHTLNNSIREIDQTPNESIYRASYSQFFGDISLFYRLQNPPKNRKK